MLVEIELSHLFFLFLQIMSAQKPFPAFSLNDQDEKTYTNSDFAGKKVVFYFYPKDDTPGCTIEAKDFRDLASEFEKLNVRIVGISPDDAKSHCKFVEKYDLNFLLLSDPEHKLLEALGIWVEKNMYGKKYFGVERTTYLVNEEGVIEKTWNKVNPKGHAEEVLEYARSA